MDRLILAALCAAGLFAQQVHELEETPVFKVDVVSKTTMAVNYQRSGATGIDFIGTALMPMASGKAKVESKRGRIEISAEFSQLREPWQFGAEYLTYVLWGVTPEGRSHNLGEVLLKNRKAKLRVTTDLQVFGLIVTAEPYYSVSQPSDLIVLENEVRKNTKGRLHFIEAKYELLKRGQYEKLANPLNLTVDTKNVPLELYEARNAVQIARSIGADKYAADIFKRAEAGLKMAENGMISKATFDEIAQHARQSVQSAEDARMVALERQEMERQRARQQAAEAARAAAEKAEMERQLEAERRARAEAEQLAAQRKMMEAELQAARAAAARAESEAARTRAILEQQAAERRAVEARRQVSEARELAARAEREKAEMRQRLLDLFNQVLETRDTERGLVVNMSDVLFDVGKFNLRPVAREKLARLSGIMASYPGLNLECEGHTDSTGSLEFNNKLSLQRAEAVQEYLISQGIPNSRISAVGMGPSMPVESNDTRDGRQKNRRVEIIVSGEVIGARIGL